MVTSHIHKSDTNCVETLLELPFSLSRLITSKEPYNNFKVKAIIRCLKASLTTSALDEQSHAEEHILSNLDEQSHVDKNTPAKTSQLLVLTTPSNYTSCFVIL